MQTKAFPFASVGLERHFLKGLSGVFKASRVRVACWLCFYGLGRGLAGLERAKKGLWRGLQKKAFPFAFVGLERHFGRNCRGS